MTPNRSRLSVWTAQSHSNHNRLKMWGFVPSHSESIGRELSDGLTVVYLRDLAGAQGQSQISVWRIIVKPSHPFQLLNYISLYGRFLVVVALKAPCRSHPKLTVVCVCQSVMQSYNEELEILGTWIVGLWVDKWHLLVMSLPKHYWVWPARVDLWRTPTTKNERYWGHGKLDYGYAYLKLHLLIKWFTKTYDLSTAQFMPSPNSSLSFMDDSKQIVRV